MKKNNSHRKPSSSRGRSRPGRPGKENRGNDDRGRHSKSGREEDSAKKRPFRSFEKRKPYGREERGSEKSGKEEGFSRNRDYRGSRSRPGRPGKENRGNEDRARPSKSGREEDSAKRPFRSFEKRKPYDREERGSEKSGKGDGFNRNKDYRGSRSRPGRPGKESRDNEDRARPSKSGREEDSAKRPFRSFEKRKPYGGEERSSDKSGREEGYNRSKDRGRKSYNRPYRKKEFSEKPSSEETTGMIRLNKYISNSGVCSRREADDLISSGAVSVNGKVITEMGYKVSPGDIVRYGGESVRPEKKVYLLLNKPKDYITTADDPQERKNVLQLLRGACKERVFPVGRLDRNTTGVLLFTNDGELAKKLTHPRYGVKKLYHVSLDKNLRSEDMNQIAGGVELEDGFIKADEIAYASGAADKKEIGIQIHSGRNRIIRRLFEHFGYKVKKLDRVAFAGLTKKDIPRGKWRFLSDKEVAFLKMMKSG